MYLCLQINSCGYHLDSSWIWDALPIQRMVLELAIMPSPGWEAITVNTAQLYEQHFCFEIRHKGFCSRYSIQTTQTLGVDTQLMLPFAASGHGSGKGCCMVLDLPGKDAQGELLHNLKV